jgi:hypothetical protein
MSSDVTEEANIARTRAVRPKGGRCPGRRREQFCRALDDAWGMRFGEKR